MGCECPIEAAKPLGIDGLYPNRTTIDLRLTVSVRIRLLLMDGKSRQSAQHQR